MDLRLLTVKDKLQFNKLVTHVVQSWEWGEFREKLGLRVLRYGLFEGDQMVSAFQLTLHPIPFTKFIYGYLPKGPRPDKDLAEALIEIGRRYNCIAIKIEPNIPNLPYIDPRFKPSKSMFTKHNFLINLGKSEEDLLKSMHPKTRYNIKVAQRHGVWVEERDDTDGFHIYADLYFSTVKRQKYHGHSLAYHKLAWETLREKGLAKILIAFYTPPESNIKYPLTAWMLLTFKDTIYYPYGGSSDLYRQTMSSTLLAWEAIKLGKKLGLKKFDLWGALGENPNPNDPFFGFHRFKSGLGGELVEYLGTFDLVLNSVVYQFFNQINKFMFLKVFLLKLLRR